MLNRNLLDELVHCNSQLNFDRFSYYKVSQQREMWEKLKQAVCLVDLLIVQQPTIPAPLLHFRITFSRKTWYFLLSCSA